MYQIVFYQRNDQAISDAEEFIKTICLVKTKPDQTLGKTIVRYFRFLGENGTRIGEPFVKHVDDGIWELRPNNYRFLFFYWRENTYVFLNFFLKKTNKTPISELDRAKRYRRDWLARKGE